MATTKLPAIAAINPSELSHHDFLDEIDAVHARARDGGNLQPGDDHIISEAHYRLLQIPTLVAGLEAAIDEDRALEGEEVVALVRLFNLLNNHPHGGGPLFNFANGGEA